MVLLSGKSGNGISKKEWDYRKKLWDILLSGDGVPNQNGVVFEFLESRLPFPHEVFKY